MHGLIKHFESLHLLLLLCLFFQSYAIEAGEALPTSRYAMRAFVLYVVTLGLTTHSFATLDFEAANSLQCLDEKRLLLPRSPCGRDSGSTKLLPRNSSVDEEREERDEGDEQLVGIRFRHHIPSFWA